MDICLEHMKCFSEMREQKISIYFIQEVKVSTLESSGGKISITEHQDKGNQFPGAEGDKVWEERSIRKKGMGEDCYSE